MRSAKVPLQCAAELQDSAPACERGIDPQKVSNITRHRAFRVSCIIDIIKLFPEPWEQKMYPRYF